MRRAAPWLVGLVGLVDLVGLVACQFPTPADRFPDAATDAPTDAPTDAREDVVTGYVVNEHLTASGSTDEPVDLTTTPVQVLIRDTNEPSGFRTIDVTAGADGRFTIEPIAPGQEFYLRVGRQYYVTTSHELTIRQQMPTRRNTSVATQATEVTLEPQPGFTSTETLVSITSPQLGVTVDLSADSPGAPLHGDWLANLAFTYDGQAHLPSTAAQDELYAIATSLNNVAQGPPRRTITGSLRFTDPTIEDGVPRSLTGRLAPPATSYRVDVLFGDQSAFEAGYTPDLDYGPLTLSAHAVPVGVAMWGALTCQKPSPAIVESTQPGRAFDSFALHAAFPDPFPSAWPRVLFQEARRSRWFKLSGQPRTRIDGGTRRLMPLPLALGTPPDPQPPPTNVRINGQPANTGGGIRPGGAPVVLTWAPVSAARQYHVTVLQILANGFPRTTAFFFTTKTELALPPEVLAGAEFFAFAVGSFAGANDFAAGDVRPRGLPGTIATEPTAVFRITETCGDGHLDLGEACDAAGESATCDSDCTVAECGDGTVNATAGEPCDTVFDTIACNRTCTTPRCGDGTLNRAVEDCDDGNATDDDNGCSASCRFNNVCGDGILQSQAEFCDASADTAGCDSDCTLVECGDGHRNAAAGEQCDDGNPSAGDGCSDTCQLE